MSAAHKTARADAFARGFTNSLWTAGMTARRTLLVGDQKNGLGPPMLTLPSRTLRTVARDAERRQPPEQLGLRKQTCRRLAAAVSSRITSEPCNGRSGGGTLDGSMWR